MEKQRQALTSDKRGSAVRPMSQAEMWPYDKRLCDCWLEVGWCYCSRITEGKKDVQA